MRAVISAITVTSVAIVVGFLGGTAIALTSSGPSAVTAKASDVYGCISGKDRAITGAYTVKSNFKGCPSGFPVTIAPASPVIPVTEYGVGEVLVDRGTGASAWATYSTPLGSPVGDTAQGTFRFTCKNVTTGCDLSVQAYATTPGYEVYPRLLINKSGDDTSNAETYCEYADGSTNEGASTTLGSTAVTVPLAVGSSYDCGSLVQTGPTADGVTSINVPGAVGVGEHYDVQTTLTFSKVAN